MTSRRVETVSTILDDPDAPKPVDIDAVKRRERKRRLTRASTQKKAPRTPEETFLNSVDKHRMIVLKNDGLYRHVKFAEPGTNIYRFDLVTWPGHLVITGDLQDYHFSRLPDMFQFFRDNPDRPHLRINPDYWSQKLVGGHGHQVAEQYSFQAFKESLVQQFWWSREYIPEGMRAEVWRSIKEEILDDYEVQESKDAAYRAASEYQFVHYPPRGPRRVLFQFDDVYEWRFTEWDWHFLISLHAIVWGIVQWDTREHKTDADWLREDLVEERRKRKDLEGMYQDLLNDMGVKP